MPATQRASLRSWLGAYRLGMAHFAPGRRATDRRRDRGDAPNSSTVHAPRAGHGPCHHAVWMFVVSEAEAAAIRTAFEQQGELSAAVELRRLFSGITDNVQARECARVIASWSQDGIGRFRPRGSPLPPADETVENRASQPKCLVGDCWASFREARCSRFRGSSRAVVPATPRGASMGSTVAAAGDRSSHPSPSPADRRLSPARPA